MKATNCRDVAATFHFDRAQLRRVNGEAGMTPDPQLVHSVLTLEAEVVSVGGCRVSLIPKTLWQSLQLHLLCLFLWDTTSWVEYSRNRGDGTKRAYKGYD